ncbi:SDR family NAD(P)-dependent oxidoreductase [Nocardia sp. CA-135398]|uniref:SDR family NAD(P)-dependent oxidoreductase n=1 Tax=Nocardia sp. CA-135398 TaxID=3239977 RepID=UPI003D990D7A
MSGFKDLAGRVAVVTGGASGIGAGIARQLAAEGMRVVIADVERDRLEQASAEMGVLGLQVDVADSDSVKNLADSVLAELGAVHVVVNNAGVGAAANIVDMSLTDWRWVLDVNLYGVIYGVHHFLPLLLENTEGGHIVNTASIGGLAAMPAFGGYCVSKAGVVALTETLALELELAESKVGASVLCPATVRTNIKNSSRNRPSGSERGGLSDIDVEAVTADQGLRWLEPDDVGRSVVNGIRAGDRYILTHPETYPTVQARHDAIADAFTTASLRF